MTDQSLIAISFGMEFPETGDENIRFGPFELKPNSGEIFRDGAPVKLPPQPFKILLFLARNSGQLVTRTEIQAEIWGTETFVDFEKGLNLCIAQIRETLGDDARKPQFIETLSRRGYRFIGEIETHLDQSPKLDENQGTAEISQDLRRKNKLPVLAISLLILTVVGFSIASYYGWKQFFGNTQNSDKKMLLLVLPLKNLNQKPEQDYFSDGLTEEMITRLGALEPNKLGVIARTTALTYKKNDKDIRTIGQELGVNYVLEGNIRRENGRLHITMQLVQVADQTNLWTEAFEQDEQEILEIQREIASRVASSLSLKILPTFASEVEKGKFAKPEAFDAYLKGRYLITKDTPDDLRRSLAYFDQAIAEDPQFAPSYAAQVEALVLLADWTGTITESDLPKAKAAALKAVELEPAYAEGIAALASVQLWLEWNRDEAEKNFKKAVELNPNNPLTRINYGRSLLARGKTAEAEREFKIALQLDPVSLLTTGLAAYSYLNAGRSDQAIVLCRRMLELEPKSPAAHDCLLLAYVNKKDFTGALEIIRQQEKIYGNDSVNLKRIEKVNAKETVEAKLRDDLDYMNKIAKKGEKAWIMYAAWISVKLGEKDQALEWLERALTERSTFMLYLRTSGIWDILHDDLRFSAMRQRIPF